MLLDEFLAQFFADTFFASMQMKFNWWLLPAYWPYRLAKSKIR
jgi:hypothetical protein